MFVPDYTLCRRILLYVFQRYGQPAYLAWAADRHRTRNATREEVQRGDACGFPLTSESSLTSMRSTRSQRKRGLRWHCWRRGFTGTRRIQFLGPSIKDPFAAFPDAEHLVREEGRRVRKFRWERAPSEADVGPPSSKTWRYAAAVCGLRLWPAGGSVRAAKHRSGA